MLNYIRFIPRCSVCFYDIELFAFRSYSHHALPIAVASIYAVKRTYARTPSHRSAFSGGNSCRSFNVEFKSKIFCKLLTRLRVPYIRCIQCDSPGC